MRYIKVYKRGNGFIVMIDGMRISWLGYPQKAISEAHAQAYLDKEIHGDSFEVELTVTPAVRRALTNRSALSHIPERIRGYDYR